MNINLNNYEAYFLDYHERSLPPALVEELMEFIANHPELRQEFESYEPISLKDTEGIIFGQKDSLKKQQTRVNSSNFDEYAIGYIEGTLPIALQQDLKTFVRQNSRYEKEIELYKKTKLSPNTSNVFEDKYSLKRGQRRPVAWYYRSVAASVALLIVAYFMLSKNETPKGNILANKSSLKDNTIVANQVTKSNDTNAIKSNNSIKISVKNITKNNTVVTRNVYKKQNGYATNTLNKSTNNIAIVAVGRGINNIQILPFIAQSLIPVNGENSTETTSDNLQDIAFINGRVMKYNSSNTTQQEVAPEKEYKEKAGNKFLYLLAKYTCKGLHKITGQHIKMEKYYDSDTTNIVAYQLDLGKKRIEFPVKE